VRGRNFATAPTNECVCRMPVSGSEQSLGMLNDAPTSAWDRELEELFLRTGTTRRFVPASEGGMGARKLNQCLTPRESTAACRIWWMGRAAVLERAVTGGLSSPVVLNLWAPGGPDQDCDVRSGRCRRGKAGHRSRRRRSSVNVGSDLASPSPPGSRPGGGQARRSLMRPGRGGVAVVLRGRESRPHGEGRQREGSRCAVGEGRC
jgi:hypothetical protein